MRRRKRRAACSALVIMAFGALAACGGSGSVDLPSNTGHRLDDALRRLHAAGLRATFAGVSTPCGDGLPYVNVQSPRAPVRVHRHAVIELKFSGSLIPSPTGTRHPYRVSIPRLVGKDANAIERLRGIWACVHVDGASATSASRLVIVSQHPPAGTRVPAYGVLTARGFRPTTVDVVAAAR